MSLAIYFFPDVIGTISQAAEKAKSSWEIQFVADLRQKYFEWGDTMFMSEKQAKKLTQMLRP